EERCGLPFLLIGNAGWTSPSRQDYSVGLDPTSVAVGDFNGDGKSDLAVANQSSHSLSILLSLGDSSGTLVPTITYSTGKYPAWLATGDFNRDGSVDLVVPNTGNSDVSIALGNSDGSFRAAAILGGNNGADAVAVGDFDNDGIPDVVFTNRNI